MCYKFCVAVELDQRRFSGEVLLAPDMGISVHPYIPKDACVTMISEMAAKISGDYMGRDLLMVQLVNGATIMAADLSREIDPTVRVKMAAVQFSSYGGNGTESGQLKTILGWGPILPKMDGVDVLLIDDIADTRRTLHGALQLLHRQLAWVGVQPTSIRVGAFLSKPDRWDPNASVELDYVGMTIADKFVVGEGLDYLEEFRNLKGIYEVVVEDPVQFQTYASEFRARQEAIRERARQFGFTS